MPRYGAATNAIPSYRFIPRKLWTKLSVQVVGMYLWSSAALSGVFWEFSSLMLEAPDDTKLTRGTGGLGAPSYSGRREESATAGSPRN